MKKFLLLSFVFVINVSFSQVNLWNTTTSNSAQTGYKIHTTSARYFTFDILKFQQIAKRDLNNFVIKIPVSETESIDFKLTINTTMSEELMAKYPEIRSYNGYALDGSHRSAKINIDAHYFRAMILQPGSEVLFIDPVVFTNTVQNQYVLYKKSEFITDKSFTCNLVSESIISMDELFDAKAVQSCELRTYRVAIAATGEYTAFHGGTIQDALAAQVTTLNRVNSIYERDLAITMTMVGNNDQLIYDNAGTDPFTNGNPDQMIDENQSVINSTIGASNYDIGHVFGTNSGGLAQLNCVCRNSEKAMGVTGSGAPIGDPFDIDYVAHEMGHQFGANHTFNNACGGNRNSATAMETGSGSTVMGYAGVCPPNVQLHSDGYFHAISLKEIGTAISSPTHTCPVKTPLNNVAPSIVSTSGNFTIPSETPFMLKAIGNDADGDSLTYCWEQMDKEIASQAPKANSTKGPSFRSYSPTNSNIRYIPSIANQTSQSFTWERLSTQKRTYKFRVTVRDNAQIGGCTEFQDIVVSADTSSGPFVVTYPNLASVVWTGLTTQTVTWDVARTDLAPVACQNVKILISIDGGLTFTTLIENTPNDGSEEVTVPNVTTTKALIMVQSESETFFDISNRQFKINQSGVGVNAIDMFNIQLYPNPTSSQLTVDFDNVDVIHGYRIYTTSGQLVMEHSGDVNKKTSIDVSKLSNGMYIFETIANDQKVVLKVLKN